MFVGKYAISIEEFANETVYEFLILILVWVY